MLKNNQSWTEKTECSCAKVGVELNQSEGVGHTGDADTLVEGANHTGLRKGTCERLRRNNT